MSILSSLASVVKQGVSDSVSLIIPGSNANRLFVKQVDQVVFDVVRVFDSRFDYFEKSRLRYKIKHEQLVKDSACGTAHALSLSVIRDFLTKEAALRELLEARFKSSKMIDDAFSQASASLLLVQKVVK